MPLPLLPLITAGAGLIGQGINAVTQSGNNRRQINFAREQYQTQRKDALADWNMQNQYNSPQQQMQRLKDAGLNPNLVYGSGATATAASQPRSSSAATPNINPVQVDPQNLVLGYAQMRQMDLQVKAMMQSMAESKSREDANRTKMLKDMGQIDMTAFNLGQKRRLADTTYETALKTLENSQVKAALGWQNLEQSAEMFPKKLRQAEGSIANTYAQIRAMDFRNAKTYQETEKIKQDIHRLQTNNYINDMTKEDQITITREMSKLAEKRAAGQSIENDINTFKKTALQHGMSPTVVSDIIGGILRIVPTRPGR